MVLLAKTTLCILRSTLEIEFEEGASDRTRSRRSKVTAVPAPPGRVRAAHHNHLKPPDHNSPGDIGC
jgi:hypothetical protein